MMSFDANILYDRRAGKGPYGGQKCRRDAGKQEGDAEKSRLLLSVDFLADSVPSLRVGRLPAVGQQRPHVLHGQADIPVEPGKDVHFHNVDQDQQGYRA